MLKNYLHTLLELQKKIIDRQNLELQQVSSDNAKLLNEKEWLLKEIHHRVKNNLQIAISLLNTQSYYLDNAKAVEAIRQSRNRMYVLSLIHQRLYQADNLELIPIGLIVNEAVTNSIKYAFPQRNGGSIRIRLTLERAGYTVLGIARSYHSAMDMISPTPPERRTYRYRSRRPAQQKRYPIRLSLCQLQ